MADANIKAVLYRFGSTGVVQVLSRAAELLGLVPVFPVRNASTFTSGSGTGGAVFRDCVLMKKYVLSLPTPYRLLVNGNMHVRSG